MVGYQIEKVVGSSFFDYVSPNYFEGADSLVSTVLRMDGGATREIRLLSTDGRDIPVQASVRSIYIDGVRTKYIVVTDLTEKEELMQKTLLNERYLAIGRVTAMVAHDLRGPLSLISQSVDAIDRFPDRRERMLQMVKDNSVRALSMIEDVRQATREIVPSKKPTDVGVLARKAIEEAKIPSNVKSLFDVEGDLPVVMLDPGIMRRVLDNLIGNAVEAMPGGGVLSVAAKRGRDGVVIEVSDTGVGISADAEAHMWEPFFTTKPKGFGLGLPFCRRAVEAHGGSINFKSNVGEGTTFTLRMPADNGSNGK
jgi:signal transduction histidine kinase